MSGHAERPSGVRAKTAGTFDRLHEFRAACRCGSSTRSAAVSTAPAQTPCACSSAPTPCRPAARSTPRSSGRAHDDSASGLAPSRSADPAPTQARPSTCFNAAHSASFETAIAIQRSLARARIDVVRRFPQMRAAQPRALDAALRFQDRGPDAGDAGLLHGEVDAHAFAGSVAAIQREQQRDRPRCCRSSDPCSCCSRACEGPPSKPVR